MAGAGEGADGTRLLTDAYLPPFQRVNEIVQNDDVWCAAFGVKLGDAAYVGRAEQVLIW